MSVNNELLKMSLAAAVPLAIHDLQRLGGPTDRDIERAKAFADTLAAHGDELLFKSKKSGVTATLFTQLAESLAVLAFAPGGCKLFGEHWSAGASQETREQRSV